MSKIIESDQRYHFKTYKRYPVTLVKGVGSRVWDDNGREYIDALAGIAVNNMGHCHPKIVKAIQAQAEKLMHVSNFFTTVPQVELAEKLVKLSNLDRVFFTNSGTEAIEGAIKIVRLYANKHGKTGNVICMNGAFHGRTMGALAMGQQKYQDGFTPMLEGFERVPFNDLEAIKNAINDNTPAVFIEPIQGEGGIHVADKQWLNEVRALCYEHKALLVFDEIQCGIGRTGRLFAYEHFGVVPDILCLAKGLGGGFPIGAVLATEEAALLIEYGKHGTTFGGNPLAASAGIAALDVIKDEKLLKKAEENGSWLRDQIKKRMKDGSGIEDVRGLGLMIGVQMDFPGSNVGMRMLEKGVIANITATNAVRLVPPLNIPKEDLQVVLDVMMESIKEEREAQAKND